MSIAVNTFIVKLMQAHFLVKKSINCKISLFSCHSLFPIEDRSNYKKVEIKKYHFNQLFQSKY